MSMTVQPTEDSAKTWAAKPFVPDDLRAAVANADILLVPNEGYGDRQDLRFFPAGTSELLDFIKTRVANDVHVEVAIADQDYKEVSRHAGVMYLATFVVNALLAPIVARLISEYILVRFGRRKDSTTIKTSITLYDETARRAVRVDYDGPATAFPDAIINASKQLQSGEELPTLPDNDSTGSPHPDQNAPTQLPRQAE